jgi:D-sedoheptulose 7-phosphate isomerase
MVSPKIKDFIEVYFSKLQFTVARQSSNQIGKAIQILYDAWAREALVYVIGNGGSASTASHFACDLSKLTIYQDAKRFKAIALVDNIPLASAWTNDSGFGSIFVEQLRAWLKPGDVLVAFSVHGGSGCGEVGPWSQNIVQAVAFAKERGAQVLGFAGFGGGILKELADVCLVVPLDSEPFGTPLVESFHVVLHHLICAALYELIKENHQQLKAEKEWQASLKFSLQESDKEDSLAA